MAILCTIGLHRWKTVRGMFQCGRCRLQSSFKWTLRGRVRCPSAMPETLVMHCPACGFQHIDEGEWATRPHKTHLCAKCGHLWRPKETPTVGVV